MPNNYVPQGILYSQGYGMMDNPYRDRSAEQANSYGPQYNYAMDPFQSSNLGRYVPPTLTNPMGGADKWANTGGYSYNVPNSFGSAYGNSYNMYGPVGGFPTSPMEFGGMWNTPQQAPQAPLYGGMANILSSRERDFVPNILQSMGSAMPVIRDPSSGQRPSVNPAPAPSPIPAPAPGPASGSYGWGVRAPVTGPFANMGAARRAAGI